jgi:hypothetical protein
MAALVQIHPPTKIDLRAFDDRLDGPIRSVVLHCPIDDDLVSHAAELVDEWSKTVDLGIVPAGVDHPQPVKVQPQRHGTEPGNRIAMTGRVQPNLVDERGVLIEMRLPLSPRRLRR